MSKIHFKVNSRELITNGAILVTLLLTIINGIFLIVTSIALMKKATPVPDPTIVHQQTITKAIDIVSNQTISPQEVISP